MVNLLKFCCTYFPSKLKKFSANVLTTANGIKFRSVDTVEMQETHGKKASTMERGFQHLITTMMLPASTVHPDMEVRA